MDPYSTIGVTRSATPDEIKRAYRKLAQQWHPDLNPSTEAKSRFNEIQQAYGTLILYRPSGNSSEDAARHPFITDAEGRSIQYAAFAKRQNARDHAVMERARSRKDNAHSHSEIREATTQTIRSARAALGAAIGEVDRQAMSQIKAAKATANRQGTPLQDLIRIIESINTDKNQLIQRYRSECDHTIARAVAVQTEKEQAILALEATAEQMYQDALEVIERQFHADIASEH